MARLGTNGSSMPGQVAEATAKVVGELGDRVRVSIHPHNDAGCGIANAPAIILALTIELDTPTLPSEACCHVDQ